MSKKFSQEDERQIRRVLEDHLKAAAIKEPDAFFVIFAPQAMFIGTDDTEQWERAELIAKLDESKSGWDMTECLERHIHRAPEKPEVAAFYEVLRHEDLGILRGSGTVIKHYRNWMIFHYVLSFSVPNAVVDENLVNLLK